MTPPISDQLSDILSAGYEQSTSRVVEDGRAE